MTRVSNDKIVINPKELKARLGGADDSASKEFTDSVADEILSVMNCSYILKKTDISFTDNGCNLGFDMEVVLTAFSDGDLKRYERILQQDL